MVKVLNFEHFIQYFFGLILPFMQLVLQKLSGKANSVDPDQTAPSLFAYVILSKTSMNAILGHLPYCNS